MSKWPRASPRTENRQYLRHVVALSEKRGPERADFHAGGGTRTRTGENPHGVLSGRTPEVGVHRTLAMLALSNTSLDHRSHRLRPIAEGTVSEPSAQLVQLPSRNARSNRPSPCPDPQT